MNAAKPQLVVNNPKTSETKSNAGRGASELREAVDIFLEQDSMEIAEALSKCSKSGKIQSIQFMYALAKEKEKAGESESARKFRSIATEWANSPEWKGDLEPETSAEEEDAN
jgi:hypothetical protein